MATEISSHEMVGLRKKFAEKVMWLLGEQNEQGEEAIEHYADRPFYKSYWNGWDDRGKAIQSTFAEEILSMVDDTAVQLLVDLKAQIVSLEKKVERANRYDIETVTRLKSELVAQESKNEAHKHRWLLSKGRHKFHSTTEAAGRRPKPTIAYYICGDYNTKIRASVAHELMKMRIQPAQVEKLPTPFRGKKKKTGRKMAA